MAAGWLSWATVDRAPKGGMVPSRRGEELDGDDEHDTCGDADSDQDGVRLVRAVVLAGLLGGAQPKRCRPHSSDHAKVDARSGSAPNLNRRPLTCVAITRT